MIAHGILRKIMGHDTGRDTTVRRHGRPLTEAEWLDKFHVRIAKLEHTRSPWAAFVAWLRCAP